MNTQPAAKKPSNKAEIWMPIYIPDYLGDTMHLTTEQHGAYLLLIMAYWRNAGALPDDNKRLAAITRMGMEQWLETRPVLEEFFRVYAGAWHHGRIDLEISEAQENIAKASAKGKAAAEARWGKNGNDAPGNASGMQQAMPKQCVANATSPSPSPSPNTYSQIVSVDKTIVGLKPDAIVHNNPKHEEIINRPVQKSFPVMNGTVKKREPTPAELVFTYWQRKLNHQRAKLDNNIIRLVKKAIQAGYTVKDLQDAIDGCSVSPHHMGINDRGTKYDSLELIMRDSAHISRFIGYKETAVIDDTLVSVDQSKPKAHTSAM